MTKYIRALSSYPIISWDSSIKTNWQVY